LYLQVTDKRSMAYKENANFKGKGEKLCQNGETPPSLNPGFHIGRKSFSTSLEKLNNCASDSTPCNKESNEKSGILIELPDVCPRPNITLKLKSVIDGVQIKQIAVYFTF